MCEREREQGEERTLRHKCVKDMCPFRKVINLNYPLHSKSQVQTLCLFLFQSGSLSFLFFLHSWLGWVASAMIKATKGWNRIGVPLWIRISGRLRPIIANNSISNWPLWGDLATGFSLLCHSQLFLASDYTVPCTEYTIFARPRGVGEETWCHPPPPTDPNTRKHGHSFEPPTSIIRLVQQREVVCRGPLRWCCLRWWFFFFLPPTCIVNHCQVHTRLSNDTQPLISGGAALCNLSGMSGAACFDCHYYFLFPFCAIFLRDITTLGFGKEQKKVLILVDSPA